MDGTTGPRPGTGADEGRPAAEPQVRPGQLAAGTLPGRPCSIARALDLIGEKWTLLAIREISFGNHRFNEIARNTGAPRDRLAARLNRLVAAGIVEQRVYQESPRRAGYHLTRAGRELTPVLRALLAWGDRWVSDEPPATLQHAGHDLEPGLICRACGTEPDPRSVSVRVNTPGWSLRGPANAGTPHGPTARPAAAARPGRR